MKDVIGLFIGWAGQYHVDRSLPTVLPVSNIRPKITLRADLAGEVDDIVKVLSEHADVYVNEDGKIVGNGSCSFPGYAARDSDRMLPLSTVHIALVLSHVADCVEIKKSGAIKVPRNVPFSLISKVLKLGHYPTLRPLSRVTNTPQFRADGTIQIQRGYDAITRTFLTKSVDMPILGETMSEAVFAAKTLMDLLKDFPFVGVRRSRSIWFSCLFTRLARALIDGEVPVFTTVGFIGGHDRSVLWDTIAQIVTGDDKDEWPHGRSQDRKSIERGLTVWRQLGSAEKRSSMLEISFSDRRYRDLDGIYRIKDDRAKYLHAALTILRAWHCAGRPVMSCTPVERKYHAWASIARQCVLWLASLPGLEGELTDPVAIRNDENADLGEFLLIWEGLGAVNTRTALAAVDGWAKTSPKRRNLDLAPQAKALRDYLAERVKVPCVANLSTILAKLKPRSGDGLVVVCADGAKRSLKRTSANKYYVAVSHDPE